MNVFTKTALSELSYYGLEPIHPILHIIERSRTTLLGPAILTLPTMGENSSSQEYYVVCVDKDSLTDVSNTTSVKVEEGCMAIHLTQLNVYVDILHNFSYLSIHVICFEFIHMQYSKVLLTLTLICHFS